MATKKKAKAKAKSSRRKTRSRASARKKPARRAARKPARKPSRRSAKAKGAARKSARRKGKAPARKAAKKSTAKKRAAAKPAPKPAMKKRAATPKSSGVLGEGDWKSGERYNESLQEWGAGHDATALAREAEAALPEDIRESSDMDAADSAARGTEKKSEPDEEW